MTTLHLFALNADLDLRHTHLTRAKGEAPVLPPLKDWLGVPRVATGEIELFPVKDLDDMALSDYVTAAFAPDDDIPAETRTKLDALDGSVLLVPDTALDGAPDPKAEATLIATIPLARPDHAADLPPADVQPLPRTAPEPEPRKGLSRTVIWLILGKIALILGIGALIWGVMR